MSPSQIEDIVRLEAHALDEAGQYIIGLTLDSAGKIQTTKTEFIYCATQLLLRASLYPSVAALVTHENNIENMARAAAKLVSFNNIKQARRLAALIGRPELVPQPPSFWNRAISAVQRFRNRGLAAGLGTAD